MTDLTKKYKKFEKVVINVGVGRLRHNPHFDEKVMPEIIKELALITGQKASPRPAKIAIAGFKTREGDIIGLKITLRGHRMRDFLERLINIVFPRVRDFRGIDKKVIDQKGNLNLGFKDQLVFPEIIPDKSKVNFGLQVTIVPIPDKKRVDAIDLYKSINFPLK